jgi:hypothetical protein
MQVVGRGLACLYRELFNEIEAYSWHRRQILCRGQMATGALINMSSRYISLQQRHKVGQRTLLPGAMNIAHKPTMLDLSTECRDRTLDQLLGVEDISQDAHADRVPMIRASHQRLLSPCGFVRVAHQLVVLPH